MKFRAQFRDSASVKDFTKVIHTVSLLSKPSCVLRLTRKALHFVLTSANQNQQQGGGGGGGSVASSGSIGGGGSGTRGGGRGGLAGMPLDTSCPQVWSEISCSVLFCDYILESKHPDNEILLEIGQLGVFLRAMKSAALADMVVIKLTKKNSRPHLSVKIIMEGNGGPGDGNLIDVVQNVPVALLKNEFSDLFKEPSLPAPEVNVYLPGIKVLKSIVDRMKSLSFQMQVMADSGGNLSLRVHTDQATVNTYFRDLESPKLNLEDNSINGVENEEGGMNTCPGRHCSVWIDSRKLSVFLGGNMLDATNVIASFVPNKVLLLLVLQEHVSLTYCIPAINIV
eukprot:Nk52_evm13s279 gene=Nk52_evmTU13s279